MHSNGKQWNPRFLVVGCGSIGKRHIRNLLGLGNRDIVAFDVAAERRKDVTATLGIATVDDLRLAWEQRPEVCLITTPTSWHLPLALEAAERGCHLFIEKPLSHNWEGVERLLDTVRRKNLVTLVGCNLRFRPGLRKVKNLLAERAIGRVIAARVEFGSYLPNWHPWEDYRRGYSARGELGGGIILDAIHEIDYARWLLGEAIHVVCFADKISQLEIDTEDTAALLIRFASGVIGEVHLDYVQRAARRKCRIIGEGGTIQWSDAEQVCWSPANLKEPIKFPSPAGWKSDQMYIDEMAHFLRCIAGEEKPELDVDEAAKVLRIALAAKQSAEERNWIELRS